MPGDAQEPKTKSIIHPVIDTFAIGALSIAFLMFLLLFEPAWADTPQLAQNFLVLTAILNWPHFMATYALMYRSRDTVERYPMASKWIPLVLAAACTAGVVAQVTVGFEGSLKFLMFMAGGYLAWHYTGQTWGMMASFSFLSGAGFNDTERKLIRTGLRILLAWHLVWFFGTVELGGGLLSRNEDFLLFYTISTYTLIPIGGMLGMFGLWKYRQRIERPPAARVLVPFVAIVLWYISMAINPLAIFWVQLSHALQYLLFPMRVEINRGAEKDRPAYFSALIFAMWALGLGVLMFEAFPRVIVALGPPVGALVAIKVAIGAFINIHHYFADGVIWKISNPAVRKELFAHIPR